MNAAESFSEAGEKARELQAEPDKLNAEAEALKLTFRSRSMPGTIF